MPPPAKKTVKLSYRKKQVQALNFMSYLHSAGYRSVTVSRDTLKDLFLNGFKPQQVKEKPTDPVISLSEVRYLLIQQGWLVKRKDKLLVVDGSKPAISNEKEMIQDRQITATKSRHQDRRKGAHSSQKVSRLAVDQHVVIHQQKTRNTRSSSQPLEQRQPAKPQEETDQVMIEHENARSLTFNGTTYVCTLCEIDVRDLLEARDHVTSHKHSVHALLYSLKFNRPLLTQDKQGISIICEQQASDGNIHITVHNNEPFIVPITIINKREHGKVVFKHCGLLKQMSVFKIGDRNNVSDDAGSVILRPGATYTVEMTVLADSIGIFTTWAFFAFALDGEHADSNADDFYIMRSLSASCSSQLVDDLAPEAPYVPLPRHSTTPVGAAVIEGLPLPRNADKGLESEIELGQYHVPPIIRQLVNQGMVVDESWSEAKKEDGNSIIDVLYGELTPGVHRHRFSTLLHVEELQTEVEICKSNIDAVHLHSSPLDARLLTLKVPGLSRKQHSVVKGSCLYVCKLNSRGEPTGPEFKGYVHDVIDDKLYLGFNHTLQSINGKNVKFSVRFTYSRFPIRVQHQAVLLAEENFLKKVLFPTVDTTGNVGVSPVKKIRFFDHRVATNTEQKQAVLNILRGSSHPAPYIIFGPPGTGKTVTIVEAVKQVVRRVSCSHVLLCAPSNSAADLLCSRLLTDLQKEEIFRMSATSRDWKCIPKSVMVCTNYDVTEKRFFFPSKADIQKYRIVICTLVTAARLVSAKFPAGHFTHVIIDEAGYATEPETLIPLAGILHDNPAMQVGSGVGSQIVLAGDPEQLGPVLHSPIAIDRRLGISLLERLMRFSLIYQRGKDGGYDPHVLTKLVRNYRSHPAILHLPNKSFYDEELQAYADRKMREALCRWEHLSTPGFPLLFHGCTAIEQREHRSPSFFNAVEVAIVVDYVQKLLTCPCVGSSDIGIISPYCKQIQKIRKALELKGLLQKMKLGTVEEFQGQERLVIIISTVRTSPDCLSMDLKHKLGFLTNPKRFNVSITRAKALLIIVGNPYVLSKDVHWNKLLEYCRENGAYCGTEYDPEEKQVKDLRKQFSDLKLNSVCRYKDSVIYKLHSHLLRSLLEDTNSL